MHEAAAVPLRAVRDMQQEFIQAQAAMTQQSLAVQQRALSHRRKVCACSKPSLPSWLAQLTPILCGNCARRIRSFRHSPGGRIISCPGYWNDKPARSSVISRMPLPSNALS